ncbi:MAG: L,D-transpeptidase catalytic domain [Syntrophus sp. PtaU1.Bin208]|nr:MAG: L,D-transpeptidase catalytic domain [Syntrophus sp. PtaU1.Bin208]
MLNCKRTGCIAYFLVIIWLTAVVPGYGNGAPVSDASDPSFYEENGVERVVKSIGPKAEARIRPFFDRAHIPYPSSRLAFVVVKEEMELEVWAESGGKWVHVRDYEILAASGWHGPKLRRGDRQVPEGIYQIVALNPASRFHLSMKINYPNDYDLQKARDENRTNLGGDIFIHGKDKSRGCLAVGDTAIEELFLLVAKTGTSNVEVVITPHDMRKYGPNPSRVSKPSWIPDLYNTIWQELSKYKAREGA